MIKEITGIYNRKSGENTFLDCNCDAVDTADRQVRIIANGVSAHALCECYDTLKEDMVNKVDGLFLMVVAEDQQLRILSDITSSTHNIYYTRIKENIYYSTSLKKLLLVSQVSREIDLEAARCFLFNGFILGRKTLFRNVHKQHMGHMVLMDRNGIHQKRIAYLEKEKDSETSIMDALQSSILRQIENKDKIHMPLSSGFDSNIVLDTIRKKGNVSHIDAYTIGGEVGSNEIPVVMENTEEMENLTLNVAKVGNSAFDDYTDIIWRLDGSVYEVGVFLQYALAKCVSMNQGDHLICGECADQVFHGNYTESMKRGVGNIAKANEKFTLYTDPFMIASMIIMKKSALMLESFGIEGRYPFLSRELYLAARKHEKENGYFKTYYKKQCLERFDPKIAANISKIGGATSNQSLLTPEAYEKLKEILQQNEFVQSIVDFDAGTHTPIRKKMIQNGIKVYKGCKKVFQDGLASTLHKIRDTKEDRGMDYELKQLYLMLFYEMFATGRYDDYFGDVAAPIKTSDVIGQ